MSDTFSDEQIRDGIIQMLYKAHRNPKGKYKNVTFSVLQKEVREYIDCSREDILREIRYLIEKKLIKDEKVRYAGTKVGNIKFPAGYTEYYSLTSKAIDLLEPPSKYANIGYMITRHTIRILKASENFETPHEYRADFQPDACFLPIEADVDEKDRIQLVMNGEVKEEKVAGEIKKYYDQPLAHIEVKWKKENNNQPGNYIHMTNSSITAPVTQGSGNIIVTYKPQTDIENIIKLIREKEGLDEETKTQVVSLVESELPIILEEADSVKTRSLIGRLKGMGQAWLIPIITQVAATYIQYSLGIN
ncbi:MAG TPA: hypothetical protein VJG66_02850 [Patescibacteria group bacterium]|nr:hypothetical protein [Patescibacteria group bacterium]